MKTFPFIYILQLLYFFFFRLQASLTGSLQTEKEEGIELRLPLIFPALVSLGGQNLTAIVVTASLASSVGHDGLTALGANCHAGGRQLPVGTTALIAAGLGHFTLGNSHG